MTYSTEIEIELGLRKVVKLFNSAENLYKWQEGLSNIELLEGTAGKAGAISRLTFNTGKKELFMEEEIVEIKTSGYFHVIYTSEGMVNHIRNTFSTSGRGKTIWKQENDFEIKGFMNILAKLAPGAFRKQTLADMNRFKDFVENKVPVGAAE